jgi:hypothetical protein
MYVSSVVLTAMTAYVHYAFEDDNDAKTFADLFKSTEREIMSIYTEAVGGDLGN